MSLFPVIAGPALLVAVGYGVTVVAPATANTNTTRTAETRTYSASGTQGREVYANNGCVYCHSLQRRDTFGDGGLGPAPSSNKEALNDRPAMLGGARYGPDLSCVGDRVPGAAEDAVGNARIDAMVAYLGSPSSVHENSTMPSYAFLDGEDLRRLATYLVEHTCAAEAAE